MIKALHAMGGRTYLPPPPPFFFYSQLSLFQFSVWNFQQCVYQKSGRRQINFHLPAMLACLVYQSINLLKLKIKN